MVIRTKGETIKIEQTVAGATAVEVRIGGAAAPDPVAMTAVGSCWSATIDTASLTVGEYVAQLWATFEDSSVAIVGTERFKLQAPLGVGETRSQARIALDMIEAMLAGQAKEGVRRYRINNRELERYSVAELLQLKSHFAAEVQKENRRDKGLSGLGPRIAVRF